jgi:Spy/CpxP family protein refolding chaperone
MRMAQLLLTLVGLFLIPNALSAQTQEETDQLQSVLYPPELIMRHRRAIDLNDEQRDAITRMIEELTGRVNALQWQLLDQMESLMEALEGPRVDQDRALDRLDTVLDTEKEVKRLHLELLIRIKNVLRAEQQETLDRLREGGGNGSST